MEYIIFVDGSYCTEENIATCAVIIYNNNKLMEKILINKLQILKNSIEVELLALKVALKYMCKMIKKIEVKKIMIFTDCKSIVDVLNTNKKYKSFIKLNSNLYNYVYSTNNLLINNENINYKIEYLPRKFNISHKYCYDLLKKYKKIHKNNKM